MEGQLATEDMRSQVPYEILSAICVVEILDKGFKLAYIYSNSLVKGPFLYYVRVKGWVGDIAKYLLFLTGVGGWFWITLT